MASQKIKPSPPLPWFAELRYMGLLLVGILILITAVFIVMGRQHYSNIKEHQLLDDRASAKLYALLLEERLLRIVKTMESYTHRPLLIKAVGKKNVEGVQLHLMDLSQRNPDSASLVVTDIRGILWASQPHRPNATGKIFAYRDWYAGVSKNWKTYISNASSRTIGEKDTAIYIAVPVFDNKGAVSGILVNIQRSASLGQTIRYIPNDENLSVNICDRKGVLIFSTRYPYSKTLRYYPLYKYRSVGREQTTLVPVSGNGGEKRYISYASIADIGWFVFLERDSTSLLKLSAPYLVLLAAISVLLFLTTALLLLYFRRRIISQTTLDSLRAEKELAESEIRFRELFDHMSSGVAIYQTVNDGEDFIISDINQAGRRITQIQDDVHGKSVRDIFPGVDASGLFRIFQQVWWTEIAAYHPVTLYHDASLSFWVENYVYKLPSGEIVAVFDDVSDRKKAEDDRFRLMNIMDGSPNEIYIFNAETLRFEYVNQGALKNIGYTDEEIKKMTPLDIKPYLSEETFRKMLLPLIEKQQEQIVFEAIHRRKNGTEYPVEVRLQLFKEHEKSVFFSIIINITERKAAEREIIRINAELEERVNQRTAELASKNAQLKRLNRVFIDRELRMRELKAKVDDLENQQR